MAGKFIVIAQHIEELVYRIKHHHRQVQARRSGVQDKRISHLWKIGGIEPL